MKEPSSLDWVASYKEERKDLVSACTVCLERKIHPFTDVISFMKVSVDLEDFSQRRCWGTEGGGPPGNFYRVANKLALLSLKVIYIGY